MENRMLKEKVGQTMVIMPLESLEGMQEDMILLTTLTDHLVSALKEASRMAIRREAMENLAMEASKASSKVFARWDAAELIDLK